MTAQKMTLDALFAKVVRHLIQQGVRALSGARCVYLAGDGKMCAVGCLIPPEKYRVEFEGILLDAPSPFRAELLEAIGVSAGNGGRRLKLLIALQALHDDRCHWHDGGGFNAYGRARAHSIAQQFGLTEPADLMVGDAGSAT